jgi:hypothetical protein
MYFGDKTGEPRRRSGDAAVVAADDLAQILGIEAGRQGRRADQIAEHDRQLPALGLARRGWSSDRFEQPMGDRGDTHFPQSVCRIAQPAREVATRVLSNYLGATIGNKE